MRYTTSIAALALLPLTTLAQSQSVISLFLMNTDPQSLVASVISADASTTQYEITCPSSVDAVDCGYRPAITVGQTGASLYGASVTSDGFTMSYQCTLYTSGATSAVCAASAPGSAANSPEISTETLMASEVSLFPVTITAGLEKLGEATTTAKSGGSSSTKSASGSKATAGSSTASGAQATTSSSGSEKVAAGCGGLLIVVALGFALA